MTKAGTKPKLKLLIDTLSIIVGSALYSVGLHFFTAPNEIAPGGVGGISTLINSLSGMSIGLLYAIINVPLLIIGLIFLGKCTMIKTVISVAVISFLTDYGLEAVALPVYENGDRLLAAIAGGVLFGIGTGLIYRSEGTSGGTDIITKLINKRLPHFRIGVITLAIDAVIVSVSAVVYHNIESALYAIIAIFLCSKIMDLILYGSLEGKMLLIFSESYEKITDFIIKELSRGVTLLHGSGAYSGKDKIIICCAVQKNEYAKLKRRINEIDRSAFIIITNAGEVLGFGFSENN